MTIPSCESCSLSVAISSMGKIKSATPMTLQWNPLVPKSNLPGSTFVKKSIIWNFYNMCVAHFYEYQKRFTSRHIRIHVTCKEKFKYNHSLHICMSFVCKNGTTSVKFWNKYNITLTRTLNYQVHSQGLDSKHKTRHEICVKFMLWAIWVTPMVWTKLGTGQLPMKRLKIM